MLLICSFCLELNAQNPFDLKSRLKGNQVVKTDTAVVEALPALPVVEENSPLEEDTVSSPDLVVDTVVEEVSTIALGPDLPEELEVELPPEPVEESFAEPDPVPEQEIATPISPPPAVFKRAKTPGFFQSVRHWNRNLTQNLQSSTTQALVAGNQNLLFGIALFILLLLAVLMVLNRRMLRDAYRAMSNDNYLRFLFRDYQNKLWIYRTFYLYFFINAGFFIYLTVSLSSGGSRPSLSILPIAVGFIMMVYCVRHLVLQIIGSSFPVSKETELFGFIIMLINIVFGLVLTPLNLALAFGPPFLLKALIYTGLGLFIFLYIFRQLKGLFLSSRLLGTYLFHFFLYFCIVEIAPLLVIGKLASTHLGVH